MRLPEDKRTDQETQRQLGKELKKVLEKQTGGRR